MKKFIQSPYVRMTVGIVVVVGLVILVQLACNAILQSIQIDKDSRHLIISIFTAAAALAGYIFLYRYYEKREITELKLSAFGRNAEIGLATGASIQVLVIFVLFLSGGYMITSINPIAYVIPGLAIAISSAAFEEILFRGIIFRLLEEKTGSIIALFISALIFGALHLVNENSTIFSAVSVAVEAGILLAAAYIYARNLWLPIFLHFGWNFVESGIFGVANSGNEVTTSLFTSKLSGPEFLTGGGFGPENSIQAVVFGLIAALIFLSVAKRQNKFIKVSRKKVPADTQA
jgi:membrane protease YdiL (CAAX protease family)